MVTPFIQVAPETCAWCRGKGKYGQYDDPCHICQGQGSVLVTQPAKVCPWCNGEGGGASAGDRCKICDGSGWAHTYKPGISR